MSRTFHPGELAVQERAGVRERASRVAGSVHDAVPDAARLFLEQRAWVIVATAGADGRPWASLLAGSPGFARVVDPRTLRIDAVPFPGDPLADALGTSRFVGLLAIDPATRRRMRLNGRLAREPGGALLLHADQVYANCPKYIVPRAEVRLPVPAAGPIGRRRTLTEAQRARIRAADTFFIATVHPDRGADASHRGGPPGFIRVEGDRLVWPDYAGNMMYNTLGNLAVHPWAGLLIPDFDRGGLLQLTGRAAVDWDPAHAAAVPGAQRLVELEVEEVVELGERPPGEDGAVRPW